jgi:hypothetical protein
MMKALNVIERESKSELSEYLEQRGCKYVILGKDAEAPGKFYSVDIDRIGAKACVGIISSHFGIRPVGIWLDNGSIVLGYDRFVTAIDPAGPNELFSLSLSGPFYFFIIMEKGDSIVVVHELGLLNVSCHGEVLWAANTDVIEDVELRDDYLLVKIIGEAQPILISTLSGETLKGN